MKKKDASVRNEMDTIYKGIPVNEIPWNIETPPNALVELYKKGMVKPCKTMDLGCGAGNYAIYFASNGFEVTGVDISKAAIKIAKENAKLKGVKVRFKVCDVLGDMSEFNNTFEFAYDWEVLHHVYPAQRKKYEANVARILKPNGKYLSVCFSEKDRTFAGTGKYRETRLGTHLYFSSEIELQKLFGRYFKIKEIKTINITGKNVSHKVNYIFMEKK